MELAGYAFYLLVLTLVTAAIIAVASIMLPGGKAAILALSGINSGSLLPNTLQTLTALDVIFPIYYCGSLMLLVTSLQVRKNRPLVRILLSVILIVAVSDFFENALVATGKSNSLAQAIQPVFSVLKFGALGLAAVLFSAVLPAIGKFVDVTRFLTRYAVPVGVGAIIYDLVGVEHSGIAFELGGLLILATMVSLTLLAANLAKPANDT